MSVFVKCLVVGHNCWRRCKQTVIYRWLRPRRWLSITRWSIAYQPVNVIVLVTVRYYWRAVLVQNQLAGYTTIDFHARYAAEKLCPNNLLPEKYHFKTRSIGLKWTVWKHNVTVPRSKDTKIMILDWIRWKWKYLKFSPENIGCTSNQAWASIRHIQGFHRVNKL